MDAQHNSSKTLHFFKQGMLLFWCFWFSIACLSNITDFLSAQNIIHIIPFQSGNYFAVKKVLSIYNAPASLLNLLFSLDVIAQGLSAFLFLRASYLFWQGRNFWPAINIAFGF